MSKLRRLVVQPNISKRVYLRTPTEEDCEECITINHASKKFYANWVSPPTTRLQFKAYIQRCALDSVEGLLVCKSDDDVIVGVINISQIFHGNFKNAYMGYYIGEQFSGQGYMTEGMQLALHFAFRTLKLHRLEANIQPGNVDSIKLVKRVGFIREGFSRRYLKIAGKWRDHERWAITAEDWRVQTKRSRKK